MRCIVKNKKTKTRSELTEDLLRSAEQRVNFVYMMVMIALEFAIGIYVLINTWDISRFYFGGIAGALLLISIIINAMFIKKPYPWIKYIDNALIMVSFFYLGGLSDLIILLLILIPFINSFYMRPYFTAASGLICIIMMYFGYMGVVAPIFDEGGNIVYDIFSVIKKSIDFSDETVVALLQNRSFLIAVAVTLVAVSVYLSVNSRRFAIRQAELMSKTLSTETELNVARDIQEGILSTDFPDNESYAIYADMSTASQVGGDFYDHFLIDETHLAIVIGDVSGHGMAAAMFMTLSKTLIKVYAQSHNPTDKVLALTNRYLLNSNPAKLFVTSWLGILDLTTGVLSYSNAGHNYPVMIRADGKPEFLRAKPDFVLGRKRLIRYRENRINMEPGDKLLIYTDGVTEAQSPEGVLFGDERLLNTIELNKDLDQKELINQLRSSVEAYENGNNHNDDVTTLALYFKSYYKADRPKSKTFFLNKESFDSVTDYIIGECKEAGCDETAIGDITVAVSEILANIDLYAYEKKGGEVEIQTKCRDQRMSIVFKDNGSPFNPLLAEDPDISSALHKRKPGGLGIFIVKKLMTDVRYAYYNKQNVLTIEKDF